MGNNDFDWGDAISFGVGYATGNPMAAKAAGWAFDAYDNNKKKNKNTGHPSGGTAPDKGGYNFGDLANITMQAAAARKSSKKQAQAMQNAGKLDLGYLRQEAENNGFNPLTVLQSTGGAGSTKSANAGLLASSQFWATYADGLGELNNRQYEQGLLDANKKPEKTEREKFIDRHGIPLLVPATTGGMEGKQSVLYMTINPELMETRMSELMGSMFVQGLQYTYQNGVPFDKFVDVLSGLPPAFTKSLQNLKDTFPNLEKGEIPTKDELVAAVEQELGKAAERKYKEWTNGLGEYLDSKLPKKNKNGKIITTPIDQQQKIANELGL
jgi:hypothetical protein